MERKTIEAMILALHGPDVNAVRGLQQFIGQGRWAAEALVIKQQALVAEWFGDPAGVAIVDGSGFPKRGPDSVGVAPQYCGHVGKIANCQQGVFLIYATPHAYTFLDERLYLSECWFGEEYRERWRDCAIPEDIHFQTEPELGLAMIRELAKRGVVPFRWVTAIWISDNS